MTRPLKRPLSVCCFLDFPFLCIQGQTTHGYLLFLLGHHPHPSSLPDSSHGFQVLGSHRWLYITAIICVLFPFRALRCKQTKKQNNNKKQQANTSISLYPIYLLSARPGLKPGSLMPPFPCISSLTPAVSPPPELPPYQIDLLSPTVTAVTGPLQLLADTTAVTLL